MRGSPLSANGLPRAGHFRALDHRFDVCAKPSAAETFSAWIARSALCAAAPATGSISCVFKCMRNKTIRLRLMFVSHCGQNPARVHRVPWCYTDFNLCSDGRNRPPFLDQVWPYSTSVHRSALALMDGSDIPARSQPTSRPFTRTGEVVENSAGQLRSNQPIAIVAQLRFSGYSVDRVHTRPSSSFVKNIPAYQSKSSYKSLSCKRLRKRQCCEISESEIQLTAHRR
jgi:hypothetical protein